ncbi:glycosyltransferase [Clostridium botulinum]|uniref:Glycosyltransferase n=2 Tax=Clostridium botulinum TaxID=1491 RepID=A0A9Q1ZDM6_CLOBO|nr:glycosyltransferase [Clostridium botulinum]KLU76356.1 glycosyltransferase [Clostridium botulinum V891]KEH99908.1 glycosyltransferase [Clostridium botulinum D str. 16868]KEI03772.1 glycosyltransferase [Clostridium botulinum C/D str. Sp77]KOA73640.1 glycosyltransferase [Clostridium botulinum]KOA79659.1 glycosyltransferase [Clostridium botulinum]
MKKTITFLMDYLGSGGAERVTSILVNYFCNNDYIVNIVVCNRNRNDYVVDKRVNVIFLPEVKSNFKLVRAYKRYIFLKQCLMSLKSDVIISLCNAWAELRLISTRQTKKSKLIMSERNDPYSHPESLIMKKIRDFNYRFATIMVFQTQGAREYFPMSIQKKGIVIPNPIKEDLPEPYKGERKKVIVNYCRLHKQKNLTMLIDAFNIFSKEYKEYNLEIYGRGELKESLKEHAISLGLKEKVLIKDFEKDIHNKIKDSAMFVSSSDYEGISNSMLEALAIGLPTICTDCPAGGARMVINSFENGILVPVGDTKALYEAMKYMHENPKESEKMSKNATEIRNKLATDVICKQWAKLI